MDNNNNRKKIFIRFLKENNCYNEFMYNLTKHEKFGMYQFNNINDLLYRLKTMDDLFINEISLAFCWDETTQGFLYWNKITDKWNKIVWNIIY